MVRLKNFEAHSILTEDAEKTYQNIMDAIDQKFINYITDSMTEYEDAGYQVNLGVYLVDRAKSIKAMLYSSEDDKPRTKIDFSKESGKQLAYILNSYFEKTGIHYMLDFITGQRSSDEEKMKVYAIKDKLIKRIEKRYKIQIVKEDLHVTLFKIEPLT